MLVGEDPLRRFGYKMSLMDLPIRSYAWEGKYNLKNLKKILFNVTKDKSYTGLTGEQMTPMTGTPDYYTGSYTTRALETPGNDTKSDDDEDKDNVDKVIYIYNPGDDRYEGDDEGSVDHSKDVDADVVQQADEEFEEESKKDDEVTEEPTGFLVDFSATDDTVTFEDDDDDDDGSIPIIFDANVVFKHLNDDEEDQETLLDEEVNVTQHVTQHVTSHATSTPAVLDFERTESASESSTNSVTRSTVGYSGDHEVVRKKRSSNKRVNQARHKKVNKLHSEPFK